jgi:hypothetical protein
MLNVAAPMAATASWAAVFTARSKVSFQNCRFIMSRAYRDNA